MPDAEPAEKTARTKPSPSSAPRDETATYVPRTFWLGVANGGLVMVGFRMIAPGTVLTFLIMEWTDQKWIVGLASAITGLAFALPQILVSHILEGRLRKLPFYWAGSALRVATMGIMVLLLLHGPAENGRLMLSLFLALYFIFRAWGALSSIPFNDILAKAVPPTRRGAFVMLRRSISGVLIILLSPRIIDHFLADDAPYPIPANYGYLFLIAMGFMALSWGMFSFAKEPIRPISRHRITFAQHLRRGPRLYAHDASFRGLLQVIAMSVVAMTTMGFYAAFAKDELGAAPKVASTFVLLDAVTLLVANAIWARVSDRVGNRAVLIGSGVCGALTALLMLAATLAPHVDVAWPLVGRLSLPMLLVYATVVSGAFYLHGQFMGEQNYLLEIAPERRRPTYVGFRQALLAPMSFVPILAGLLVDRFSYTPLFVIAALAGLGAVHRASRLHEPRGDLPRPQA